MLFEICFDLEVLMTSEAKTDFQSGTHPICLYDANGCAGNGGRHRVRGAHEGGQPKDAESRPRECFTYVEPKREGCDAAEIWDGGWEGTNAGGGWESV